jgi:hypothetical protein
MCRQSSLYSPHRHPVLFRREIEPTMNRSYSGGHVCSTGATIVQRWSAHLERGLIDAVYMRCARRGGSLLPQNTQTTAWRSGEDVHGRVFLANVSNNVDIVWRKAEFPSFAKVSRCQRETKRDRKTEPEISRREEKVVESVYVRDKPTGLDSRVTNLHCEVRGRKQRRRKWHTVKI